MALNDVIKKKQATGDGKPKAEKKNPFDDVRIFMAVIVLACIGLIVATVFGMRSINETLSSIDEVKTEYKENQLAIANLLALQSKSEEYKAQRDEYDAMIPKGTLDQQQIMIDMETSVESYNCLLSEVTFGEATSTGAVKQQQVVISITGTYEDIMRFCYDTVNAQQIKRIDCINMSEQMASGKESLKTAQITIMLFAK